MAEYDLSLKGAYTAPAGLVDLSLPAGSGGIELHLEGSYAPPVGEVNLVLGESGSAEGTTGVLSAEIAALAAAFTGTTGVSGIIAAALGLAGAFSGDYLVNVWRGLANRSGIACEAVPGRGYGKSALSYEQTIFEPATKGLVWAGGAPVAAAISSPMSDLQPLRAEPGILWGTGLPVSISVSGLFNNLEPLHALAGMPWEKGAAVSVTRTSPWIYLIPRPIARGLPYGETSPGPGQARTLIWGGMPVFSPRSSRIPWDACGNAAFVWPPPQGPPEPPEPPEIYRGSPHLNLECLLTAWGGYVPLFIPTVCRRRRRTWIVINEIVLRRLSDSAVIPCTAIEIYGDIGSWAWSFDAQVPLASSLALVHPGDGPVEIEAVINGWTWRGIVEGFGERRVHGQYVYAVTGRSRSALLSAPYAPFSSHISTEARTAVQLAEAELSGTGWTLDWDTVDWLVPAGAWSYDRETPMGAILRIAQAVGAAVQTDAAALSLRALPRYAVSPWNWGGATPDKTVPEDILYQTSAKWEKRPPYQGVYVSGVTQGVLCRVYRSGTSGAPYKEMITDGLITHVDSGRERGRNELAAAGRWEMVGAELPVVSSGAGVLLPGSLIEIDGASPWIGQVISCRISAAPAYVRQAVEIERYMEGS